MNCSPKEEMEASGKAPLRIYLPATEGAFCRRHSFSSSSGSLSLIGKCNGVQWIDIGRDHVAAPVDRHVLRGFGLVDWILRLGILVELVVCTSVFCLVEITARPSSAALYLWIRKINETKSRCSYGVCRVGQSLHKEFLVYHSRIYHWSDDWPISGGLRREQTLLCA